MSIIDTGPRGQAAARMILAMIEANPYGSLARLHMVSPGTTLAEVRNFALDILSLGRAGYMRGAVVTRGRYGCPLCDLEARMGFTGSSIDTGPFDCRICEAGGQPGGFSGGQTQGQMEGALPGGTAGRAQHGSGNGSRGGEQHGFGSGSSGGEQHGFGNGPSGEGQHGFGNGPSGVEQHGFGASASGGGGGMPAQGGFGGGTAGFRGPSQSANAEMAGTFGQGPQRQMGEMAQGFGGDSQQGMRGFSGGFGQSSQGGLGGTDGGFGSMGPMGGLAQEQPEVLEEDQSVALALGDKSDGQTSRHRSGRLVDEKGWVLPHSRKQITQVVL
jgi:hypothetical protein